MDIRKIAIVSAMLSASLLCSAQENGGTVSEENTPKRWGIIDFSASYLRQSPDYESPLETQELMGTVVEITGEKGYWLQVSTPQPYTAWCTNKGIAEVDEQGVEDWISAPRYIVTAPHSTVYTKRTAKSQPVCDLLEGDIIRAVMGKPQPKVHPNGLSVRKDGWAKVTTPSGREGWVRASDVRALHRWAEESRATEKSVVETALRFVGTPYLWGGMSPNGFDCSGLVRFAYFMNGLLLPRNANQMAFCGLEIPVFESSNCESDGSNNSEGVTGPEKADRKFCADSLRPGDLLFFGKRGTDGQKDRITHVGMYIGDGRMVHSSHLVRVNSLVQGEPDCYENAHRLLGAVRIIGHEDLSRDPRFKAERIINSIYYFR